MDPDEEITNLQRIQYILDVIAEPFPPGAAKASCGCGDKGGAPSEISKSAKPTVRELVEQALYDALPVDLVKGEKHQLQEVLQALDEQTLGHLLKHINVAAIDLELRDLALFLDPRRPMQTTFEEIRAWDEKRQRGNNVSLAK